MPKSYITRKPTYNDLGIYQINNQSLLYIHVKTLNLKLLVDSGAAISILKPLNFLTNYKLNSENLEVYGINNISIKIKHSVNFSMFAKTQKFYINNFNSPFDGILGLDFLKNNKCTLDFDSKSMLINNEKFPLFSLGDKKEKPINHISHTTKIEYISEKIIVDHLSLELQRKIKDLCLRYHDIFLNKNEPLTFNNKIKHCIRTTTENPIYTKNYRYPHIHKEEVKTQIKKLLDQGIIRDSISPWNSPLWIVPKKQDKSSVQKWRVVIDYRKLNNITVDDKYPLPHFNDAFDLLSNSKFFSTIDLASGFHQIQMNISDIEKTALSSEQGHFEFTRMPFGLKNAPSTFQRVMNEIFKHVIGKICFIYMDDILVFSNTIEEHLKNLEIIFEVLRNHNLKIESDKCNYLTNEVVFIGHLLTPDGIKPNPDKVKSIVNFPLPKNEKEIKSFLGLFGYYRKFVKNFADITKPLSNLLKKSVKFKITPPVINSFNKCKEILTSDCILMYPDFDKQFILTTDASNYALGAVLSQLDDDGKTERPISFASRTLTDTEIKYSTTEKELLSMVWSTDYFRPYIFGVKFQLITDHRPLVWLLNLKDPNSKLSRWRLKLSEYNFNIKHISGKSNKIADALSRIQINEITVKDYPAFLNSKQNIMLTNFDFSNEQILDPQNKNIVYIYDDSEKNEFHFNIIRDVFPVIKDSDFDSVIELTNETKTRNLILAKIKPHCNENNFKILSALKLKDNKVYYVTYFEKYNFYKMIQFLYPQTKFIICKNIITVPSIEER
ncbi:retrovirus-related Pol polyprotein from transposon 17.6 isoform X1 [Anthonomus grandis grandis]|uniref:retrovirus-related Pol polyprotein from transposon 17.6 isoform X1 n=1 Tax=Anthonomus grandis grandis TaxID=2921223 RepID=UPI002165ADBC|nr:retrovirus-related Pol polyprotein from transposon 17.6 isoform X1 [Anthonomus grandis grandis]XP_050315787.1 retrovirus-related Pol polyprotein from transposon 17.6 isoform X1 [Anthonomus grandis grandis]XP_050315788.1 retrovirus-related Pol polyprotein from transposon 17.6 isoform X1 [Anthonomus grandis grandis]